MKNAFSVPTKAKYLFLSLLTGVSLGTIWISEQTGLTLLIVFIPLLWVEHQLFTQKKQHTAGAVFGYAYLAFAVWNMIALWWSYRIGWFAVATPVVINAFFMAVVFWVFHISKRRLGKNFGYSSLIFFWLGFEYLHANWGLAFPWLNLGNGLANNPWLFQWYEWTGAAGGSFWVLITNILIIRLLIYYLREHTLRGIIVDLFLLLVLITVPIVVSMHLYNNYTEAENSVEIVVIQPNIDPYNDKFSDASINEQLAEMLALADSASSTNTRYIIAPETAIADYIWRDSLLVNKHICQIQNFLSKHEQTIWISGLFLNEKITDRRHISGVSHKVQGEEGYYNTYNAVVHINKDSVCNIYKKKYLMLGSEKIPFGGVFALANRFIVSLGGENKALAPANVPNTLTHCSRDTLTTISVICWESAFGEYVSRAAALGADFIFIHTNDGWGTAAGAYQHLRYAQLRAVETRRSIARSANTGISAFINQRGDIIQQTKWQHTAVLRADLNANGKITFYAKTGDYIGRIAAFFAILLLLYLIAGLLIPKKDKHLTDY